MKLFISGGLLVILLSINISAWSQPKAKVLPFQDKNQTVEARITGFQRISIAAGETKIVKLTLTPEELMMLNKEMNCVVEPGAFTVMIGASCEDIQRKSTFEVIE